MIWYAVKSLYKMAIVGKPIPELIDDYFSDQDTFFEESIILVTANSFEEAYQIAEAEAKKVSDVYTNKYGQTITKEFYDSIDCFELSDPPQILTEVYSRSFATISTRVISHLLLKGIKAALLNKCMCCAINRKRMLLKR